METLIKLADVIGCLYKQCRVNDSDQYDMEEMSDRMFTLQALMDVLGQAVLITGNPKSSKMDYAELHHKMMSFHQLISVTDSYYRDFVYILNQIGNKIILHDFVVDFGKVDDIPLDVQPPYDGGDL